MTPQDLRILSTALGFTAVVMQGKTVSKKDGALRATGFANLIEEFCHTTLPDIFGIGGGEAIFSNVAQIDRLIDRFKGNLKDGKNADLPHDRDFLLQLYDRLRQRHRSHATDNLLADEILHLLNEEILFDEGVMQDADATEEAIEEKLDVQHRMANAIVKIVKEKGQCQPHDLRGEGFTQHEIALHWPMAYALAEVELKIKDFLMLTQPEMPMCIVDLITTDEDKKFAPVGEIATAIAEVAMTKGGCLPQDIIAKGFTPKEVTEHWDMAHALATVEINLMSKKPIKPKTFFRRKTYAER